MNSINIYPIDTTGDIKLQGYEHNHQVVYSGGEEQYKCPGNYNIGIISQLIPKITYLYY